MNARTLFPELEKTTSRAVEELLALGARISRLLGQLENGVVPAQEALAVLACAQLAMVSFDEENLEALAEAIRERKPRQRQRKTALEMIDATDDLN